MLKIATWNVNSLRVRLPHVLNWLAEVQPDVLALQETKLTDEDFPFAAIKDTGYFVVASGQRTYNGVAILARSHPTHAVMDLPGVEDPQRRVLCVTVGDVRVINLYVPNGESVLSKKYEYKLNWLQNIHSFLRAELEKHPKMIVLGDFNIAPDELDVHNPKRWEGKVLFSKPERQAFQSLLQLGFEDCFRKLFPEQRSYSWWDYRLKAYERGWGLRIDHILSTPALKCYHCYIDTNPRVWERPSDHAPVVADFCDE